MNGQELFEWLQAIPEDERKNSKCFVEILGDIEDLVTAKYYKKHEPQKQKPTIYLIYK